MALSAQSVPARALEIAGPALSGSGRAHILFLIDELCGKGGAESALSNTLRWLPTDRFRCSVIAFRVDPCLPMLADFPCPVQVLPLRRTYDWNAVKRAAQLASFIHKEKVDIVHTFFASADLWGGLVAKLSWRPVLISSRRDMGFLRRPKHRLAYRVLGPIFDHVLTVSDGVRRFSIEQDRLNPAKVSTIHNAVDMQSYAQPTVSAARERFGIAEATHVIASVGNIRHIKGFDVVIRAAALVCLEFPKAVFVVAGGSDPAEPQCRRELEDLASRLGITQNVRFLGRLDDVAPLLKTSDVFCLLSRSEGFSNALLEAMGCGLPCVATRVGGNEEALEDKQGGFLVDCEDYESAAAHLRDLLRNEVRAQDMGKRGQDSVRERFTPEVVISQLVRLYDELLRRRTESK
jgi:glycosyltransferase involved in cell wall biosynthesis